MGDVVRASHTENQKEKKMSAAKYDLTPRFLRFLDPHLGLPLIKFLSDKKVRPSLLCPIPSHFFSKKLTLHFVTQVYPAEELLRGKVELLCKTKLVDLALDVLKEISALGAMPEPDIQRRASTWPSPLYLHPHTLTHILSI